MKPKAQRLAALASIWRGGDDEPVQGCVFGDAWRLRVVAATCTYLSGLAAAEFYAISSG